MHARLTNLLLLHEIFDNVIDYYANMKLWLLFIRMGDCDGGYYELYLCALKEKDKASVERQGW